MSIEDGKKFSVRDIKLALDAKGSHFFSRGTMRWFGDTMASFETVLDDDGVTVMYRKPGASINVFGDRKQVTLELGFNCWAFLCGELKPMYEDDEKKRIWDKVA